MRQKLNLLHNRCLNWKMLYKVRNLMYIWNINTNVCYIMSMYNCCRPTMLKSPNLLRYCSSYTLLIWLSIYLTHLTDYIFIKDISSVNNNFCLTVDCFLLHCVPFPNILSLFFNFIRALSSLEFLFLHPTRRSTTTIYLKLLYLSPQALHFKL